MHRCFPPFLACPLQDLRGWTALLSANPWMTDRAAIDACAAAVGAQGLADPLLGPARPDEIAVSGGNHREGIAFRGLNARIRAVLLLLEQETRGFDPAASVYACESLTPLAEALRARFPGFIGSEYVPDAAERARRGLRHEDVTALSFADASFDVYLSCEVLEHVPDIARTLSEAARVLRPGGVALWTFPFAYMQDAHHVRAVLENGAVRHLCEPEFHGNPVDPEGGSLVYAVPGWDILPDALRSGFGSAEIVAVVSQAHGVLGAEIAPVLVFRARR